jgi:hypothetical protein
MNIQEPTAYDRIRRPSKLRPGTRVLCGGRVMTFLERQPGYGPLGPRSLFQCDDYRGLNGPNDDGKCTMTDPYVVANCRRVQ